MLVLPVLLGGITVTMWAVRQKVHLMVHPRWFGLAAVTTGGLMSGIIGLSCWGDTLVGIDQCSVTTGVLLSLVGWSVVFGSVVYFLTHMLKATEIAKGASSIIVFGLTMGSVGAACVDNSLYRVDDCSLGLGVPLTVIGWSGVGLTLVFLSLTYIPPMYPDCDPRRVKLGVVGAWALSTAVVAYAVGQSCLSDVLAGQKNCDETMAGTILVLIGAVVFLLVAIPSLLYYAADTVGHNGVLLVSAEAVPTTA